MFSSKCEKACCECKRRKRKCAGGIPCSWCIYHNIQCSLLFIVSNNNNNNNYILNTNAPLHPLAHELDMEFELSKYFDISAYNVAVTSLSGVKWNILEKPNSPAQQFAKYAMCALTARACGNIKHADFLISAARRLSISLINDISLVTLSGFMMLTVYWLGIDAPLAESIAHIASKSFRKLLKLQTLPALVTCTSHSYQAILNSQNNEENRNMFLSLTENLSITDTDSEFFVTQSRLTAKVFGYSKTSKLSFTSLYRVDLLMAMDYHVSFTENQRTNILSEIESCRKISCSRKGYYTIDFIEIFINWKTGRNTLALAKAIEFAEYASPNAFLFGTFFDLEYLLLITLILYENQQFLLTQKLFNIAVAFNKQIRVNVQLCHSAQVLVNFIIDCIHSSSPPFANEPPYSHTTLLGMVNNILSISSLLSGNHTLLSPRGMFFLYKSISSLCPPACSNYELFPLSNTLSTIASTSTNLLPTNVQI